jgi:hypothetical protein
MLHLHPRAPACFRVHPRASACTRVHPFASACIRVHAACVCAFALRAVLTYPRMHAGTHARVQTTRVHAPRRVRLRAFTHSRVPFDPADQCNSQGLLAHLYRLTSIYTGLHAFIQAYTHTRIHAFIHAYTHTRVLTGTHALRSRGPRQALYGLHVHEHEHEHEHVASSACLRSGTTTICASHI